MKVLSIDFDYFQKVDAKTIAACYPDGVDLPTGMSSLVWASKYLVESQRERLLNIEINREELDLAKEILENQKKSIPVLIANSHKHIYNMAHELASTDERLVIVNADMHHDFSNYNKVVDCGNWVSFLADEYRDFCWKWVVNPISLRTYGFCEEDYGSFLHSLKPLLTVKFDAVFICRSDNWLPPHLDKYFTELCMSAVSHFKTVRAEKGITEMRDVPILVSMMEKPA